MKSVCALPPLAGLLALAFAISAHGRAAFERPSENDSRRALGNLVEEPEPLRTLLTPDGDFRPVAPPKPNDWLAQHVELGQTYAQYCGEASVPTAARGVIYLMPLGEFDEESSPPLEELRRYAAIFFQSDVRLLPAYYPHELEFSPRKNPRSGQRQILTRDALQFLQSRLPADAFCLLGVTMADLYPSASWNFVFGEASLDGHVGIYSLVRYDPAFWGENRGAHYRDVILQRACKVLAHETGHTFGLRHCIYYECVMNGANHMVETDGEPQSLCPVCLRKLHRALGFDAVRRYGELAAFYRAHRWYDDLDFANRQLARVTAAPVPASPEHPDAPSVPSSSP